MNDTTSPQTDAIASSLGVSATGAAPSWPQRHKRGLIALVIGAVGSLALVGWYTGRQVQSYTFETEKVSVGTLVVKVSATGNLEPTTQVDVGSELSGTIDKVLVQDNDLVHKGQVLATLDRTKLLDQVEKSKADLMATQANVLRYKIELSDARASLARVEQAWALSNGQTPSRGDVQTAQATVEKAKATLASAEATVLQSKATLRSNETDLSKAVIRAPIDGVVLQRKIEPGQTVAAAFATPTLFLLAQNLTQMYLKVDIDEADVGRVTKGQAVDFSVDAYPSRTYPADIVRVRYGSKTTNGVVTYQGVLQVNNSDLSLRPGMTGTARITTLKHEQVKLMPSSALRFTMPSTPMASSGGVASLFMPKLPTQAKTATTTVNSGSEQTVWVLRDQRPQLVKIKVGANDGKRTEVLSGDLAAGDLVVVDATEAQP